jgi:hypothetical protein
MEVIEIKFEVTHPSRGGRSGGDDAMMLGHGCNSELAGWTLEVANLGETLPALAGGVVVNHEQGGLSAFLPAFKFAARDSYLLRQLDFAVILPQLYRLELSQRGRGAGVEGYDGLFQVGIAVVEKMNLESEHHLVTLLDDVADIVGSGKVTPVLRKSRERKKQQGGDQN